MRKILVIVERAGAEIDEVTWELAGAGRELCGTDGRLEAVLLGAALAEPARELTRWFDAVHCFEDERLEVPGGESWSAVLAALIGREQPFATLAAHSNNAIDLAPVLAVRTGASAIADCIALELGEEGGLRAVRAIYGGKVHARLAAEPCERGFLLTLRPGAFQAPQAPPEVGGAIVEQEVPAEPAPRRRTLETLTPEPGEVDISQAEVLVAVGRGIEEEENLEMIHSLAEAMGAVVACSRPVVDKKWLPKSRQVGTSGVSVKPRAYLAIGISGSFQHLGGIRGGPFLAAINKDPAAPIFAVADVGVVGDLFDIVPLLEEKIRELQG